MLELSETALDKIASQHFGNVPVQMLVEALRDMTKKRYRHLQGKRAAESHVKGIKAKLRLQEEATGCVAEERDALNKAWLTVCHEGNVPQYENTPKIAPDSILHGVRQLAAISGGHARLREQAETERNELRAALLRLPGPPSSVGDSPGERVGHALAQHKALREVVEQARDTFLDGANSMYALGHNLAARAMRIAAEGCDVALDRETA